jgi:1-pyrroline-5-carboxylate dehydrogenase
MPNVFFNPPIPQNEPILSYKPGSPEKTTLKKRVQEMKADPVDVPIVIGGKEIRTGNTGDCICPHDRRFSLGRYHKAGEEEVRAAIDAALRVRQDWGAMSCEARASIFIKAAELLSGPWRATLNGANMLNASKTAHQAEIDSACELIDFLRINPFFMQKIYQQQPNSSAGCWNYIDQRPLEGFVFAVTPFNFASIAGNLPTTPAIMGNTVVWKPASSVVYIAHFIMELLKAAGLPDGVINLVPGQGSLVGDIAIAHPEMAGIHFTGSTDVFRRMWQTVGSSVRIYKNWPRIVGETGGKDFIFAHASADIDELAVGLIRGAFEYQGQKCSAASRAYIPKSIWPRLKSRLVELHDEIKVGSPEDFTHFMCAVIDRGAFTTIREYIEYAKGSPDAEIIAGGGTDDSVGYFVQPTLILAADPKFKTMVEEIFGPVLTLFVYPDKDFEATLRLCDQTSPYALTGAIFARDRRAIVRAMDILENAAGNFYINDKPTGAVVGQQPFGGSRASGTNDKAGSMLNLQRWVSPRSIKENFVPPTNFRYPFMDEA